MRQEHLPSEEKKWLQYYNNTALQTTFSSIRLYDAIIHRQGLDRTALTYFGVKITYRFLYEQIDRVAKSFVQNGISKGDVVMLMLPTTPESVYCFYALNKIGAVPHMIDVRTPPTRLVEIANKTKPKILVVMAFYLKRLNVVCNQLNVKRIILLRGCDSMPSSVAFWYKTSEYFNGRRRIVKKNHTYSFWPEFLESGNGCRLNACVPLCHNETAVIYQTSGTTGFPKSVIHTNESLDNSAKMRNEYLKDPQPGDAVLSILPIFTMYGFVFSIHMPLRLGMTVQIVPLFKPFQMKYLVTHNKPNYIFSVPSQWEKFATDKKNIGDLSFIKDIFVAGEIIDRNLKLKLNAYLNEHNSKAEIRPDYGMTETGGSITIQIDSAKIDKPKNDGYSGIPLPYVDLCIYDNSTQTELNYNCTGEICVKTPIALKEYMHDEYETRHLRQCHPDGSEWIHTGDLGYLSENGHLYIVGRLKRMIVRFDGTKIYPIEIESIIHGIDGVCECSVVPVKDPIHLQGCLPVAFVTPEKNKCEVRLKKTIIKQCANQLPDYLQPYKVQLINEMPHNSMGKIDYNKLIGML